MEKSFKKLEDAGRSTDSVLGHLTEGELIVPKEIFDNAEIKKTLTEIFNENNADINEFIVGNKLNKINPNTGYPEFFFGKLFKSIGSIFKGKGGGSKKSSSSNNNNQMQQQMQQQQVEMQRQIDAARRAAEAAAAAAKAERDRLAKEAAERERQRQIQAENDRAASMRRESESRLQSDFTRAAENQKRLDEQASKNYQSTIAGGSGYNMGSAQQQKIAAAGGTAGPASTNAPSAWQMGIPQVLAANAGTGGTQQSTNRFTLPTAQGLQFGGM